MRLIISTLRLTWWYYLAILFFIVYMPRLPDKIYVDIMAVIVLLFSFFLSILAKKRKLKVSINLWIFFLPFVIYTILPSFLGEDIYWFQWAIHILFVTISIAIISDSISSEELNSIFVILCIITSASIMLEAFGPHAFKEYFSRLKITENVTSVEEYLTRFSGRTTGIIADVPSAGAVLAANLSVLLSLICQRIKTYGRVDTLSVLLWLLIGIVMTCMLFSSRSWLMISIAYLAIFTAVAYRNIKGILITGAILVVSIIATRYASDNYQSVYLALNYLEKIIPIFTLSGEQVNALQSLHTEYGTFDMFLSLGTIDKIIGTGIPGTYGCIPTDVGFIRCLVGVGVIGTTLIAMGYIALTASVILKYGIKVWTAPIIFMGASIVFYNFKGSSFYGLYFFPIYILVVVVCIHNIQWRQQQGTLRSMHRRGDNRFQTL